MSSRRPDLPKPRFAALAAAHALILGVGASASLAIQVDTGQPVVIERPPLESEVVGIPATAIPLDGYAGAGVSIDFQTADGWSSGGTDLTENRLPVIADGAPTYDVAAQIERGETRATLGRKFDLALPAASAAWSVVPEPGTGLLIGMGLVGLVFAGRPRAR